MSTGAYVTIIDRYAVRLIRAQRKPVVGQMAALALRLVGINIPAQVTIGDGLKLPHSTTGVVVNYSIVIGDRVTIFHGVTVGRGNVHVDTNGPHGGVDIGDDVILSVGAVVLASGPEPLIIGDRTIVAANAVLMTSTGEGEIWAGVPARRVSDRSG